MNRKNQELIDTLMAISVVSKRLAKNLAKEDKHNGFRALCPMLLHRYRAL